MQTVLLPGATETRFHGINDQGETVGLWDNTRAFVRTAAGVVTEITATSSTSVRANAINNNGYVVGSFQPVSASSRAYLRNLASELVILASNYGGGIDAVAIANGNDRVLLAESFGERKIYIGDERGNFPLYTPRFSGAAVSVSARGLNSSGTLLAEANGAGFLSRPDVEGMFFAIPGYAATIPFGINDRHQIVGAVRDFANRLSGFVMDPCSPSLIASTRSHGSGAESGKVEMQGEGLCVWFADTNAPWIKLARPFGGTAGGLQYSLDANPGAERQAVINIGTSQFVVTQASSDCRYSLTPPFAPSDYPASGGRLSMTVNTTPGCPWTTFSPGSWARFSTASGTGSSDLTLVIDPQSADVVAGRSATTNIAGVNFWASTGRVAVRSSSGPLRDQCACGWLRRNRTCQRPATVLVDSRVLGGLPGTSPVRISAHVPGLHDDQRLSGTQSRHTAANGLHRYQTGSRGSHPRDRQPGRRHVMFFQRLHDRGCDSRRRPFRLALSVYHTWVPTYCREQCAMAGDR